MKRHFAQTWAFIYLCLAFSVATETSAHENLSHRHLAGTIRPIGDDQRVLDLLFTANLIGPRAMLLVARFDLNRDGQFSEQEAQLLGSEMVAEMLGGLSLNCGNTPIKLGDSFQYKAYRKSATKLTIASLVSTNLPTPCGRLRFVARKGQQKRGLESLTVHLNAYPPVTLNAASEVQFELVPDGIFDLLLSP